MARAIWTGAISFGLVSIPVGLFSATEDHTVHFHQFERGTSDRIRYQRVNERTGKEVEYSDIVKGKDVGGGEHVIVEPDELADIAPGRSRTIDITAFVDLDDIDPIFFQKTYWLAPTDEQYARPYALLREAMTRTNRAGVATFVMRGKEYLTALRADGEVLALETLFFADEIRDRSVLDLPGKSKARGAPKKDKEMDMATGLIEAMSGPWQPEEFRDTFTERVEKLIEDKRRGREIVTESAPPEPTAMTDLIAALERSVADARGGKKPAKPSRQGPRQDSDGAPDLSGLSKADLTKMARELDVKGRSSMSRAELQEAVAAASGTSGATQRRKAS
jgi:DNA end-binding protein Ku